VARRVINSAVSTKWNGRAAARTCFYWFALRCNHCGARSISRLCTRMITAASTTAFAQQIVPISSIFRTISHCNFPLLNSPGLLVNPTLLLSRNSYVKCLCNFWGNVLAVSVQMSAVWKKQRSEESHYPSKIIGVNLQGPCRAGPFEVDPGTLSVIDTRYVHMLLWNAIVAFSSETDMPVILNWGMLSNWGGTEGVGCRSLRISTFIVSKLCVLVLVISKSHFYSHSSHLTPGRLQAPY